MYCIHCGQPLDPQGRFCATCGKPVNGLDAQPEPVTDFTQASQAVLKGQATPGLSPGGEADAVAVDQVRPWVRYWARIIDIVFWAFPGGFMLGMLAPEFALSTEPGNDYLVGMVVLLMWVFVEPLCLVVFGTTPGKSLLRIRLVYNSAGPLTYSAAMARSLKVWWRGMGAGVPLVSLFTLITAYQRLKRNQRTSWDAEGGFMVQHGKIGWPRVLLAVALLFLYFFLIGVLEAMQG